MGLYLRQLLRSTKTNIYFTVFMLFFVWILFFDLLFLFWLLVDFHKFICHTISKINNAFYMLPHIFNIVGNRQFHLAQEVLMYLSDIHTHSIASGHGTNCTISDMAKEAGRKGLKLLGISDHGPGTLASGTSSYFRSLPFCPRKRFNVDIRGFDTCEK